MPNNEYEGRIGPKGEVELHRSFWEKLAEVTSAPEVSRRLVEALGKKKRLDWYDIRDYDLGDARDDELVTDFPRDGDIVLVLECENQTEGETFIKFDSPNSDAFDLAKYRKLRHNFSNLYLTNKATEDKKTLHLLLGRGDWDIERHYPEEEIMAINADTVDSIHASASAEANKLLALGTDKMFPDGAVRNIQSELDANKSIDEEGNPRLPVVGDMFIAKDTGRVYACFTAGVWTDITGISKSLFDAHTILAAVTDNNPLALTVAEQRLVGRITGGNIAALTAAQVRTLLNVEDGAIANLVEDTTPQLGGELDSQAHSIGFTQQSTTGDGTTTIDWKLGNKFFFTFGAQNETFTFTAPSKPSNLLLVLKQDGIGSRTVTWPASVKWPGGTAPALSTGANDIDIVSFYFDGTNYYGMSNVNFS